MIVGSIKSANVTQPANTLLPSEIFTVFIKNANPNSPNTIDGTPASVPTHILKNSTDFPPLEYSEKYMEAAMPSGAAIIIEPSVR